MTPKQEAFVREYLVDSNGTQAAIRAGFSPKTAPAQAVRLLMNVNVASAVRLAREKLAEKTEITAERVLAEYARIAFYDPSRVFRSDENGMPVIDFSEATEDDWRVVGEVSNVTEQVRLGDDCTKQVTRAKVKHHCKLQALNALAKHLGIAVERVDVMSDGKPLTNGERLADVLALLDAARARAAESAP